MCGNLIIYFPLTHFSVKRKRKFPFIITCLQAQLVLYFCWCLQNVLSFHTLSSDVLKTYSFFWITAATFLICCCTLVLWSRLKRRTHDSRFSKVGLPLVENGTIVQQPLDLWTLTEQYKSAATRIIQNARLWSQSILFWKNGLGLRF